jgi:hypothetical protein
MAETGTGCGYGAEGVGDGMNHRVSLTRLLQTLGIVLVVACPVDAQNNVEWRYYSADNGATKYSPLG